MAEVKSYVDLLNERWQEHLAPRSPDAPTVISTFAGGGGSSLGLSMAGFRELLAVEFDQNAIQTLRMNFRGLKIFGDDIAKLSVAQCLKLTNLEVGQLDVFDGSPPCQGFSTMGKRQMMDNRNYLFESFTRLLTGLQPKLFVMENVAGMIKGKMKLLFVDILNALEDCGYIVEVRLLNAKYFQVPQSRERLIFLGARKDLNVKLSHPSYLQLPIITAGEAVADLTPNFQERQMLLNAGLKYAAYKYWNQMTVGQTVDDITHKAGFSGRKVDPRLPMHTVPKNDGNITMHGSMHWAERRRFTLAEYKRFGSFPDQYRFTDWSEGVKRIGNSVPPFLMRAIALHLRQLLNK